MSSSRIFKKIRYLLRFVPDKMYLQLNYFAHFKKLCNFQNPVTYNEKLNWLKLHDRNPSYPHLVDKYEAKKHAAERIGSEYIIPTLGVWDRFDQIDFDSLPERFVLKCTHDSEGVFVIRNKADIDIQKMKESIEEALSRNFYHIGREWPYKNIQPRIIAEEYMEDHEDGELKDYKFFCFDGEPKAMFVASDRSLGDVKFDYFDLDFRHLDIKQKYPNSTKQIKKPQSFDKMIEFARVLSKGFPHVRVDFYEADGKLYFGELTFYHFSGFMPFEPAKWDRVFGEWLKLPR